MVYQFPGSFSQKFYAPTSEQSKKPHVILFEFNNGQIAVSQVFNGYLSAVSAEPIAKVDTEERYGWHVKKTAIMPLSELHHIFPAFEGKTQTQAVKMLKGYAPYNSPKKSKKKASPFGL